MFGFIVELILQQQYDGPYNGINQIVWQEHPMVSCGAHSYQYYYNNVGPNSDHAVLRDDSRNLGTSREADRQRASFQACADVFKLGSFGHTTG
jgi:hypothetical protein